MEYGSYRTKSFYGSSSPTVLIMAFRWPRSTAAAGLIAFANLHLNEAGHAHIADLLQRPGYAPIR